MIFVTVGSQMPFDRLVRAVDSWAGETQRRDILAQVGPSAAKPRHLAWVIDLAPDDYRRHVAEAELVISHAGMGTIISVMEAGCPALLFPRRAALRETRNDHQVAAVRWLRGRPGFLVAETDEELAAMLRAGAWRSHRSTPTSTQASESLIQHVRQFILDGEASVKSFGDPV